MPAPAPSWGKVAKGRCELRLIGIFEQGGVSHVAEMLGQVIMATTDCAKTKNNKMLGSCSVQLCRNESKNKGGSRIGSGSSLDSVANKLSVMQNQNHDVSRWDEWPIWQKSGSSRGQYKKWGPHLTAGKSNTLTTEARNKRSCLLEGGLNLTSVDALGMYQCMAKA